MKKKIVLSSILLVTIISLLVISKFLPKKQILDTPTMKNTNSMISMMLEQDDGTYKESKDTSFTQEGYIFNAIKSKCEQGSKITWNDEAKQVQVTANKSDKCYLYFDKEVLIQDELLADANKDGKYTLYHHNANDLTDPNMTNKDKIANDDSYRFSGADADVRNYVCLDSQTTGDCESDEDLYRIIGLFKNSEEKYEMKLIKASVGTTTQLGDNETAEDGAYVSGTNYYWNRSNGTDSENVNMWAESNLNKVNLNTFYYNYITTRATYLQNHITEHTWTTGGMATAGNAKAVYDSELGDEKVKVDDNVCYTQGDTSTKRNCTQEDIEYTAHIGLFYISDYMYGTTPNNWTTTARNYDSTTVRNNNWLYIGMTEWSISRYSSNGNYARYVRNTGFADYGTVYYYYAVRPSFYLTSDAKIKEGEGSKTKPYRVTFE